MYAQLSDVKYKLLNIAIFVLIGYYYSHIVLQLPSIDALYLVTNAITLCGRTTIYLHPQHEVFLLGLAVVGALLSLELFVAILAAEVRYTIQQCRKTMQVPSVHSKYFVRYLYPLITVGVTVGIATLFFSYTERWSVQDAFYYSVMSRSYYIATFSSVFPIRVERFDSQLFLLFYLWSLYFTLMLFIANFCVSHLERVLSSISLRVSSVSAPLDKMKYLLLLLGVFDSDEELHTWLAHSNVPTT